MKWKQMIGIFAVLIVLSCLSMNVVSAHRLHVVHKISELEIEAYFAGGSPCRDAEVAIYNNEGNLYMEGVTDDEGKFSFPPKIGMGEYMVVVNATHMPGHRGETTINLSQNVAEAGGTGAELPLYSRIIAGFGYLIGIAGAAMAYMGWKQKKKYELGDKEQ
jgi:nickel transport protein